MNAEIFEIIDTNKQWFVAWILQASHALSDRPMANVMEAYKKHKLILSPNNCDGFVNGR